MEYFSGFNSSLRSNRLYFVISFSIQCVSQLSKLLFQIALKYALEIVSGSLLFRGISDFFVKFTNLSLGHFLQKNYQVYSQVSVSVIH